MVLRFLFATDLHGSTFKMRELVKKAIEEDTDMILLGGDLFRSGPLNTVESQIELLKNEVQCIFEEFPGEVLTIFGNNDWHLSMKDLSTHAPKLRSIEGEHYDAGEGLEIAGFSYIPASPFPIKDWELYERYALPLPGSISKGLCSRSGEVKECLIDRGTTTMDRLLELGDVEKKLLLSHTPPRDTSCDIGYNGEHLGSTDLREYTLEREPLAVLCGHIHESPERSGKVVDRIGSTVVANPGSKKDRLTYLVGKWSSELELVDGNPHR
ncbi:MAG: metallophosphoesterase [Candidatus Thermoplasmatota archaeon]|nr:metallophosphoesterase [Candidatus Thermoplasmatota archaeon]